MGLDYIRSLSEKPWRKFWANGLDQLKVPTLFDLDFPEKCRSLTMTVEPGASLSTGDVLVVQNEGTGLAAYKGQHRVARLPHITPDVQLLMTRASGFAQGDVRRVDLFGTTAEVSLQ